MFIVVIISLMFTGLLVGYAARKRRLTFIHRTITVLIWLLLYLLGVEVGNNPSVVNGLHTIGADALIITLAAVTGSVLFSWLLWIYILRNKKREAK